MSGNSRNGVAKGRRSVSANQATPTDPRVYLHNKVRGVKSDGVSNTEKIHNAPVVV